MSRMSYAAAAARRTEPAVSAVKTSESSAVAAAKKKDARFNFTLCLRNKGEDNQVRLVKDTDPVFRTPFKSVAQWLHSEAVKVILYNPDDIDDEDFSETESLGSQSDTEGELAPLEYLYRRQTADDGSIMYDEWVEVPDVKIVAESSDAVIARELSKVVYPKTTPAVVKPFRQQLAAMEGLRDHDWRRAVARGTKPLDHNPQALCELYGARHSSTKARTEDEQEADTDYDRDESRSPLITDEQMREDVDMDNVRVRSYRGKKRVLLMWRMGAGKTYGALMLLLQNPGGSAPRSVLVTCTNTCMSAWEAAIKAIRLTNGTYCELILMGETRFKKSGCGLIPPGYSEMRVRVGSNRPGKAYSVESRYYLTAGGVDALLIDEGSDYRNALPGMMNAIHAAADADNLIICSGTPIQNTGRDAYALMGMFGADISCQATAAGQQRDNLMFQGRKALEDGPTPVELGMWMRKAVISYYDPSTHAALDYADNFPVVVRERLEVPLSVPHALHYLIMRGRVDMMGPDRRMYKHSFPTGNRFNRQEVMMTNERDPLTGLSPKVVSVVDHMSQACTDDDEKTEVSETGYRSPRDVVYSEFLERGLELVKEEIGRRGLTWAVVEVTGDTPDTERQKRLDAFERGEVNVLLISKAASIGTNIMGAKRMYCLDAFPNESARAQTEMRVVRFRSHPLGSVVRIITVVAVFPKQRQEREAGVAVQAAGPARKLKGSAKGKNASPNDVLTAQEDECLVDLVLQNMTFASRFTDEQCAKWTGEHIRKEVFRIIAEEEEGMTISEKQERDNIQKRQKIQPLLDVLSGLSIPMPTGTMNVGDAAGSESKTKLRARSVAKLLIESGGIWTMPVPKVTAKKATEVGGSSSKASANDSGKPPKKTIDPQELWLRKVSVLVLSVLSSTAPEWLHVEERLLPSVMEDKKFVKAATRMLNDAKAKAEAVKQAALERKRAARAAAVSAKAASVIGDIEEVGGAAAGVPARLAVAVKAARTRANQQNEVDEEEHKSVYVPRDVTRRKQSVAAGDGRSLQEKRPATAPHEQGARTARYTHGSTTRLIDQRVKMDTAPLRKKHAAAKIVE